MLPPPAITTRLTGSSALRISLITLRMSSVAAMKNTSSLCSMTVSPVRVHAVAAAVDGGDAGVDLRDVLPDGADRLPDQQAALEGAQADDPHPRVREVDDLQGARVAHQALNVRGDRFLRTQVHVDGEAGELCRRIAFGGHEDLGTAGVGR